MPTHDDALPTIGGDNLAGDGLSVPSGAPAPPGELTALSWLVADLDTGDVLGACGAHRYLAPASLQKLLLVETVLPKLNPADMTTITPEDLDFEPGSSAMGLILGGQYSVETLFLGLMLNSGNDAANTLARLGSGGRGVAGTLADMNAEAKRLGAWDTHAETPSGLDGPGQVTSAYDLALIFRACFRHEDFRRYIGTRTAQIPPQPPQDMDGYQIQNDNRLLFEYPGALGGKTGFTDVAGHTYVGAAERDGRRLVAAVLGADVRPLRGWQQAARLLDWGFAVEPHASVGHLVAPGEADALVAAVAEPEESPAAPAVLTPLRVARTYQAQILMTVAAGAVALTAIWFAVSLYRRGRAHRRHWRAERLAVAVVADPAVTSPAAIEDPSTAEIRAPLSTVDDQGPPLMGQPPD
jgi:D-alanyl-D-alanine carboxypeptidase (penicillin-binding protein 5/6)